MDRNSWTIWDRNSWPYLIVSWQCMEQVMMVHCHFQDGFRRNKDSEATNIEPVWSNQALLHWHGCVIGPGNLSELPKTCLLCLKFWPLTTTTRQSSFQSAWPYMQHCPLVTWTCNCISRRPSYRKVWPLVEVQLRVVSRCDADLSLKALFSYGKYGRGTLVLILANGLWCLSEQVLQWHGETAEN